MLRSNYLAGTVTKHKHTRWSPCQLSVPWMNVYLIIAIKLPETFVFQWISTVSLHFMYLNPYLDVKNWTRPIPCNSVLQSKYPKYCSCVSIRRVYKNQI